MWEVKENAGPSPSGRSELIRYMHDTAVRYSLHFSTVRTASTALIAPIGLAASATLFAQCQAPGRPAYFWGALAFLVFVVVAMIALNTIFSRWSDACRNLERYYEWLLEDWPPRKGDPADDAAFVAARHGFRHCFLTATRGSPRRDARAQPRKSDTRTWDPFLLIVVVGGAVYLAGYAYFLDASCFAGSYFLEDLGLPYPGRDQAVELPSPPPETAPGG